MTLILGIGIAISLIANVLMIYVIYRLMDAIEDYIKIGRSAFSHCDLLNSMCAEVLNNDIYSDDPTVRAFVNVLTDVQPVFEQMSEEFRYRVEAPPAPEHLNGKYENVGEGNAI